MRCKKTEQRKLHMQCKNICRQSAKKIASLERFPEQTLEQASKLCKITGDVLVF